MSIVKRFIELRKNERHRTAEESRYWCDQYRLFIETALQEQAAEIARLQALVDERGQRMEMLRDFMGVHAIRHLFFVEPEARDWFNEDGSVKCLT